MAGSPARKFICYLTRPRVVLLLGILLRIVIFGILGPLDNDYAHLDVIRYIVQHGAIPISNLGGEAWQPPLYYVLAAPVLYLTGSVKAVQAFSLLCSILTLLLLYKLIYTGSLIQPTERLYAFSFACFLPQFVFYGLFVSNDTLATLMGVVIVWGIVRYLEKPNNYEAALLAALTGLGLLTKASFLPFLPVLLALIIFVQLRIRRTIRGAIGPAVIFLVLSCTLGSYKFVQNSVHSGTPFVTTASNSRLDFVASQRESYRGLRSFVDFNFVKLLSSPSVSPKTESSYPLLLYGTFWYQHIPDGTLVGSRRAPFNYLGSAIYSVGLIPSALFFLGLLWLAKGMPRFFAIFRWESPENRTTLIHYAAVLLLLGEVGLVIAAAAQYHLWSIMQSRLLFPGFFGMLIPFCLGIRVARKWGKAAISTVNTAQWALMGFFSVLFASEIMYRIVVSMNPNVTAFLKRMSWR